MSCQMLFDLTLGFREERQVPAVPKRSRRDPQSQRTRVPHRIEEAQMPSELAHPVCAPSQVILLLACSLLKRGTDARVPGREGLPLVERLGADFAHMINAHEGRGVDALRCAQL